MHKDQVDGILAARLLFNKMQLYFVVPQVRIQVSGIVMLNLCEYYDNTTPKTLAALKSTVQVRYKSHSLLKKLLLVQSDLFHTPPALQYLADYINAAVFCT